MVNRKLFRPSLGEAKNHSLRAPRKSLRSPQQGRERSPRRPIRRTRKISTT